MYSVRTHFCVFGIQTKKQFMSKYQSNQANINIIYERFFLKKKKNKKRTQIYSHMNNNHENNNGKYL